MSKQFDMVIYGATGYTAGLAIDYLLTHPTGARYTWAIAGRNKSKLESIITDKVKKFGTTTRPSDGAGGKTLDVTKIPIIIASSDDEASLDAMCKQAKVILAMAGPYALCGLPIVAACVRNGTHYVDITGEFQFIREAIEKHHDEAKKKSVAIVNTCGFDCVPSDIGALMMHDHVAKVSNNGDEVTEIIGYFNMKGNATPSGGTAHSIANLFKTMKRADMSPVSLNPPNARKGILAPTQKFIGYSHFMQRYTAPFVMAGGNQRTVRRSNALLGRANSVYWEAAVTKSLTGAIQTFVTIAAMGLFFMVPPLRYIVTKFILPLQGSGPSAEAKKNHGYTATFHAKTKQGKHYRGVWNDNRNAYDSTATFVVEAAATLLELADKKAVVGGVLTPAAAFGHKYLDRLLSHDCGISASIEEATKSK